MNLQLQKGDFINEIEHRPWPKPNRPWIIYQEWNDVLFLHGKVDSEILRDIVPSELELETFEGKHWVSIVVFRLEKARPRFFPHIPLISNFHEINVRTYVRKGDARGVFFLDIEAEKWLSCQLANTFSGLNYRKSTIRRSKEENRISITNEKSKRNFQMNLDYKIDTKILSKSNLERSLTELYSVYVKSSKQLLRFQVHHKEWVICNLTEMKIEFDYKLGQLHLTQDFISLAHYSPGVQVIAWNREYLE